MTIYLVTKTNLILENYKLRCPLTDFKWQKYNSLQLQTMHFRQDEVLVIMETEETHIRDFLTLLEGESLIYYMGIITDNTVFIGKYNTEYFNLDTVKDQITGKDIMTW